MSDYIEVAIAAINTVAKTKLDEEDRTVPGVYNVLVPKGLSDKTMASIALDAFHEECAVGELDNFEFYVLDPATHRVLEEDEDHESYTKGHLARNLQLICDQAPNVYSASVVALHPDKSEHPVGRVTVVAVNLDVASERALKLLWNSTLSSQGYASKVQLVPCAKAGRFGKHH